MKTFGPLNNFDGLAPTTTKGDLIARDTSANVRIPLGTDGKFLQASSGSTGGVLWASASGIPVNTLTGATTLAATAQKVLVSGTTFAIALPSASSNSGLEYEIIKTDGITTAISITGTGFASVTLSTKFEKYKILCDGTTFWPTEHTWDPSPIAYTPVTFGFGSLGLSLCLSYWSRDGAFANVNGRLQTGTVSAVTLGQVCLPGPLLSTSGVSLLSASNNLIGIGTNNISNASGLQAFIVAGTTAVNFAVMGVGNPNASAVGSSLAATGSVFSFQCRIPISGWGS